MGSSAGAAGFLGFTVIFLLAPLLLISCVSLLGVLTYYIVLISEKGAAKATVVLLYAIPIVFLLCLIPYLIVFYPIGIFKEIKIGIWEWVYLTYLGGIYLVIIGFIASCITWYRKGYGFHFQIVILIMFLSLAMYPFIFFFFSFVQAWLIQHVV